MGFRTATLKQSRIEEDAGAGCLQQVHGAGDLAGGSPESEFRCAHEPKLLLSKR
jgi:hypothetical protein